MKKLDLDLIYKPDSFTRIDHDITPLFLRSRLPFRNMETHFERLINKYSITSENINIIARKIENTCRKLLMMSKAGKKAIVTENEIMVGQYRGSPVLIWNDEIELLYHLEAMILFGRSALDLSAGVFSKFLLDKKMDSFRDFYKALIKSANSELLTLKETLKSLSSDEPNWLNLLCSIDGRSVRDKIAHQTIIKIEYREVKETSEKEYCHIIVKGNAIPLNRFIEEVTSGVIDLCIQIEDLILSM